MEMVIRLCPFLVCVFVFYCYWLWLELWTDSMVQLLGKSRASSQVAFVIRIILTEPMEFSIEAFPCSLESSVTFTNWGANTEAPDNKGAAGGHCSCALAHLQSSRTAACARAQDTKLAREMTVIAASATFKVSPRASSRLPLPFFTGMLLIRW